MPKKITMDKRLPIKMKPNEKTEGKTIIEYQRENTEYKKTRKGNPKTLNLR